MIKSVEEGAKFSPAFANVGSVLREEVKTTVKLVSIG